MTSFSETLQPAIQDLEDSIGDIRTAPIQDCLGILTRLVHQLDSPPMTSFLRQRLPTADFDPLWRQANESLTTGGYGGGKLEWPHERSARVAMQVALVRRLASGEIDLVNYVFSFHFSEGGRVTSSVRLFVERVLEPLLRDIRRLVETRALSPVLNEVIGGLRPSGDITLDELLDEAIRRFRDPAPAAKQLAVEKLWDAWERLKTIGNPDKRQGVAELITRAAGRPAFQALLQAEGAVLTKIGNDFHIRHFETSRTELDDPAQLEYLFHRLFAMIYFLLLAQA